MMMSDNSSTIFIPMNCDSSLIYPPSDASNVTFNHMPGEGDSDASSFSSLDMMSSLSSSSSLDQASAFENMTMSTPSKRNRPYLPPVDTMFIQQYSPVCITDTTTPLNAEASPFTPSTFYFPSMASYHSCSNSPVLSAPLSDMVECDNISKTESFLADDAASNKKLSLYKTELCRSFEETGRCKYSGRCQFAHGKSELRSTQRHPRYKTEVCHTFHSMGTCPYGKRCRFIHAKSDGSLVSDDDGGDSSLDAKENEELSGFNSVPTQQEICRKNSSHLLANGANSDDNVANLVVSHLRSKSWSAKSTNGAASPTSAANGTNHSATFMLFEDDDFLPSSQSVDALLVKRRLPIFERLNVTES